jgi:proteasome accessory factor C
MPKAPAEDRLGRLLAIVPWVAAQDGPEVSEVCRRFGVGEKELLDDLNLLFMCGVYPFTPDVLIDVDVADGRVWIRMADYFRRPLRLSPQEGLALVSAGSALQSVPGADPDGALATALTKLENVLGVGADDGLDVELARVTPDVLTAVRQAVDRHQKVEIDYYSFGRDGHSTRVVEPWRVFNTNGQWYLSGWCELAVGERLFRLDRISRAQLLDTTFDPPPGDNTAGPTDVYHPGPDDPLVVLDLDPPAHWIAEQYPNEGVEVRAGSVLRVGLRTSQKAWLARLLLRAGPDARVVEGDGSAAAETAARLLGRYRRQQPVQ